MVNGCYVAICKWALPETTTSRTMTTTGCVSKARGPKPVPSSSSSLPTGRNAPPLLLSNSSTSRFRHRCATCIGESPITVRASTSQPLFTKKDTTSHSGSAAAADDDDAASEALAPPCPLAASAEGAARPPGRPPSGSGSRLAQAACSGVSPPALAALTLQPLLNR